MVATASNGLQKVVPSELLITQKDKEDVWNIFTPLANKHNAVNLGQGFPNFPAADFIKVANSYVLFLLPIINIVWFLGKYSRVCFPGFQSICANKRTSKPSRSTLVTI